MSEEHFFGILTDMGFDTNLGKQYLTKYGDVNTALEALLRDAQNQTTLQPGEYDAVNPQATLDSCLQIMVDLGFPRIESRKALMATGQKSTQAAIEYLYQEPKEILEEMAPIDGDSVHIQNNSHEGLPSPDDVPVKQIPVVRDLSGNIILAPPKPPPKNFSHFVPLTRSVKPDPCYWMMLDMGFPPQEIRDALLLTDNDVYQAVQYNMTMSTNYDSIPFMKQVDKMVKDGFDAEVVKKEIVMAYQRSYQGNDTFSLTSVERRLYDKRYVLKLEQTPTSDHWKFLPELPMPNSQNWTKITILPNETMLEILRFLSVKDNLNASLVNKTLYRCTISNYIWYGQVIHKDPNFIISGKSVFERLKSANAISGGESVSLLNNVDDVGIKQLYTHVTRGRLLKTRRVYLEKSLSAQKSVEEEKAYFGCGEENLMSYIPRVILVFLACAWIAAILVSIITLPLCIDFFPQSYWWVIPYAPLFILSIFSGIFIMFKWTIDQYIPWPWHVTNSGPGQYVAWVDNDLELMEERIENLWTVLLLPFFLLFIITGVVLSIPGARDVGLWRIYFIPVVALVLWVLHLHFTQFRTSIHTDVTPIKYTILYAFMIVFAILVVVTFGLVTSKMDAVPMFENTKWSQVYVSYYLTHISLIFVCATYYFVIFSPREAPQIVWAIIITIVITILTSPILVTVLLIGLKLDGIIHVPLVVAFIPLYAPIALFFLVIACIVVIALSAGLICCVCCPDD